MAKVFMLAHFCVSPDSITFGPGIRIWEIAKALVKKGHAVTICQKAQDACEGKKEKINLIKYSLDVLTKISEFDLAYVQIWLSDKEIFEKLDKIPIIVDIYAPYLIEHAYYPYDLKKEDSFWRFTDDIVLSTLIPMQYGDFFICASDAQKKYYLGMLSIIGRVNPYNKGKIIDIVPFGTRNIIMVDNEPVLRKRIPKYKKIILWMSAFYPWLDPMLAGKVMHELLKSDSGYALAVVGAKSPFVDKSLYEDSYNRFYEFAKEKNLIDTTVYFFDWVEQKHVPKLYDESSFLIVTSDNSTLETEFSFRVRMMDALSANLPIISTGGDIVSEFSSANNMGIVTKETDPRKIADDILRITDKDIQKMKKNILKFSEGYKVDKLIGPIDSFCKNPKKDTLKKKMMFESIIDDRRELVMQLRKEVDEKEGHIKNFENALKNKEEELRHAKKIQEETRHRVAELESCCNMHEKKSADMEKQIEMLSIHVGRFKNSIIYPFYKATSSFGKTSLGKIIQKILK